MRLSGFARTTSFRLTAIYGLAFALATIVLLGAVYVQVTAYLSDRTDRILVTHADALAHTPPSGLRHRIQTALLLSEDRTNIYALFSPDGAWEVGNLRATPKILRLDGRPIEIPPSAEFPAHARLIARRLASGEILIIGRDAEQLRRLREIVRSTLIWSGGLILSLGLAIGATLSLSAMRRLRRVEFAARDIAAGHLDQRMPSGARRDEIDMFADTVNTMLAELERLMGEVKSSSDTVAHDLRTPLTRVRARLHRLQQSEMVTPGDLARITAEVDEVLDRFRAISRISEIESRERRAGFARVNLEGIVTSAVELYLPLAEARGVGLKTDVRKARELEADAKLIFEAVSNLIDNAIKFSPPGGEITVSVADDSGWPKLTVSDQGPGIPPAERMAVLQRFHRGEWARSTPGSGLGLSVVAAIMRLHDFTLTLEDAEPGLRACINCRPRQPAASSE